MPQVVGFYVSYACEPFSLLPHFPDNVVRAYWSQESEQCPCHNYPNRWCIFNIKQLVCIVILSVNRERNMLWG